MFTAVVSHARVVAMVMHGNGANQQCTVANGNLKQKNKLEFGRKIASA